MRRKVSCKIPSERGGDIIQWIGFVGCIGVLLLKKRGLGFHVRFGKQTDLFVYADWKTSFTGILILMLQLVMITLIRLKCRNFEASTADQNGGRMVMM